MSVSRVLHRLKTDKNTWPIVPLVVFVTMGVGGGLGMAGYLTLTNPELRTWREAYNARIRAPYKEQPNKRMTKEEITNELNRSAFPFPF